MIRAGGWALLLAAMPCGRAVPPSPTAPSPGGDVVAVVGGTSISRRDVEAFAAERGLDRRAALDALEAEALLAEGARRRGHRGVDLAHLEAQGLVQRLLVEVERQVNETSLTPAEIAAALPDARRDLERPARRELAVFSIRVPSGTPMATLESMEAELGELRRRFSSEPMTAENLDRAASELGRRHPTWGIEVNPALRVRQSPDGVNRLAEAAFAAPGPGPLPSIVSTPTHLVLADLRRILPAVVPTPEELLEQQTRIALRTRRARAVSDLVGVRSRETAIQIPESLVRRLLSDGRRFEAAR